MARLITTSDLPAADQVALADFTRTGCRPVRAVGRSRQVVSQLRRSYDGPQRVGRWTLHLLDDNSLKNEISRAISHGTVSQVLKKTSSSPTASSPGAWGR